MRQLRFIRLNRSGRVLLALSAVIFIYTFATSIMQYNLALFTDALAPTYTLFGIVMGLPWAFSLVTDMPIGAFADRFGRKRTIILGLVGLGISGLLLSVVSSLVELFWLLVFFGIGEGFLTIAGMASVIAASPRLKENQFVGGYLNASALGYLIGPFVAGLVVVWFGGTVPFLVFGVICFGAALVAYFTIEETASAGYSLKESIISIFKKDHVYAAELKEFFSAGPHALFFGSLMFFMSMWSEFVWVMEPIFINSLHNSAVIGGLILSAFVAPVALLDYPVGRLIDRTQQRFLSIMGGFIISGAGIILFTFASQPFEQILLAMVVSVGFVFAFVALNGIFDAFSEHHRRGYMAGVWQSAEDLGYVISPLLGGIVADIYGLRGAFLAFGFLFLLATFWVFFERKNIRRYEHIGLRSVD